MPRITSKETYAEFKAGIGAGETIHVQHIYLHADVTGGTLRLRVNGYLTDDITISGTPATDVASINAALDALPNLTAGDLVCTGTALTDLVLTGAAAGYFRILVDEDTLALTGNATGAPDYATEVTTVGGTWVPLSADMSAFQYEESSETTEVRGLSEEESNSLVVGSNASWSLSLYEANQTWAYVIHQGQEGRLRVFNQGKVANKKYLELVALIDSVSGDTPDHDVLEKEVSGMRQGKWIAPPDSYWKGS